MRIWLDTEFYDRGPAINVNHDLISIGLVREDGKELYLENAGVVPDRDNTWVQKNVLPKLNSEPNTRLWAPEIAEQVLEFCGGAKTKDNRFLYDKPEFWAFYASYDWILLCKLFGSMMGLPLGWPKYCRDVKQLMWHLNVHTKEPGMPSQTDVQAHHALNDAKWLRDTHRWLDQRYSLVVNKISDDE